MYKEKTIKIAGVDVTFSTFSGKDQIEIEITVDTSQLDNSTSADGLINYVNLGGYHKREVYWWCKLHRRVTVKTPSQAKRVLRKAVAKIDDAISQAVSDRDARIRDCNNILDDIEDY